MEFDLLFIIWLFPIVFMLHEFEEIIFFKDWIIKNKTFLTEKYPKFSKRFFSQFDGLSTSAFTVAVAEEFVLLSVIAIVSVLFETYLLWLGVFMGFFLHLFTHLIQFIVLKRYIPAIYTTFISLIYCVFSLNYFIKNNIFQTEEIFLWSIIGVAIVAVNLVFAHKLAFWFDKGNRHMN